MKNRAVLFAALLLLGISPALASECPLDMGKIDAALAGNPSLSAAELAKVTELRSQGEASHNAGDHGGSVEALREAMAILGI